MLRCLQNINGSLQHNSTWVLLPLPPTQARNVLSRKLVFQKKDKVDSIGALTIKYKPRLVTLGSQEIHSLDYEKTFAPVVKFSTLCLFLALVTVESLSAPINVCQKSLFNRGT